MAPSATDGVNIRHLAAWLDDIRARDKTLPPTPDFQKAVAVVEAAGPDGVLVPQEVAELVQHHARLFDYSEGALGYARWISHRPVFVRELDPTSIPQLHYRAQQLLRRAAMNLPSPLASVIDGLLNRSDRDSGSSLDDVLPLFRRGVDMLSPPAVAQKARGWFDRLRPWVDALPSRMQWGVDPSYNLSLDAAVATPPPWQALSRKLLRGEPMTKADLIGAIMEMPEVRAQLQNVLGPVWSKFIQGKQMARLEIHQLLIRLEMDGAADSRSSSVLCHPLGTSIFGTFTILGLAVAVLALITYDTDKHFLKDTDASSDRYRILYFETVRDRNVTPTIVGKSEVGEPSADSQIVERDDGIDFLKRQDTLEERDEVVMTDHGPRRIRTVQKLPIRAGFGWYVKRIVVDDDSHNKLQDDVWRVHLSYVLPVAMAALLLLAQHAYCKEKKLPQ